MYYRVPSFLGVLLSASPLPKDKKGISNWILQRASACVLAAYFLFTLAYISANPDLDYPRWRQLYSSSVMQIFSLLAVLALVTHALIGLWCVYTDYLTERLLGPKATLLRNSLQALTVVITIAYVIWTFSIFWSL